MTVTEPMQGNAEGVGCGNSGRECRVLGFQTQVARYRSSLFRVVSNPINNTLSSPTTPCKEAADILGSERVRGHAGDDVLGCAMSIRETASCTPKSGIIILETARRLECGWNWRRTNSCNMIGGSAGLAACHRLRGKPEKVLYLSLVPREFSMAAVRLVWLASFTSFASGLVVLRLA